MHFEHRRKISFTKLLFEDGKKPKLLPKFTGDFREYAMFKSDFRHTI